MANDPPPSPPQQSMTIEQILEKSKESMVLNMQGSQELATKTIEYLGKMWQLNADVVDALRAEKKLIEKYFADNHIDYATVIEEMSVVQPKNRKEKRALKKKASKKN